MTDNTDREKLIEKAAKAMADGEHNVLGWRGHSEDEREWYRKDAAIALAVFEEALTPTDDERESLDYAIRCAIPNDLDYRPLWELIGAIRGSVLTAGFRHTEVPEPSAERIGCNICGEALPDGEPHLCSAPQGEPSDAVLKAFEDEWYRLDYVTEPERHRRAMRAALRAAGGVR